MPVPVPCVNSFYMLLEESLYDSPLNLGLSMEALAAAPVPRACRHYLSVVSILSAIDSTVSVILSSLEAEVKPNNPD